LYEKLAWVKDDKPTLKLNNEIVSIKDMGKHYCIKYNKSNKKTLDLDNPGFLRKE